MKKIQIRIVQRRPFFWRLIKWQFPDYDPESSVAVAFGKIVYANAPDFEESYKVHESTHLKQHRHSYFFASIWWIRYLLSKKFRFSQEVEAFQNQYSWIKRNYHDRKHWEWLKLLGSQLASPLYGSMVEEIQARAIIDDHAKTQKA